MSKGFAIRIMKDKETGNNIIISSPNTIVISTEPIALMFDLDWT